MKNLLLCIALIFASSSALPAQTAAPTPASDTTVTSPANDRITGTKINELPKAKDIPVFADRPGVAAPTYVRPDAKTRQKRYVKSVVGPVAIGRTVATAGISTWRNSPEEWGDRWEGFGRRVASNFGKNVIKQTTIYGLDEAFKYDSHYYRSKDKSVGARVRNALISPVTARNRNGKRVVGIPRLAGTYTANIVAYETWFPSRYDWKDGVKSGTISLGFNAAFNLFKEFVWKK